MDKMISYVINLDHRVERWYYVREHLASMDIHPIRFSAIEVKPGWVGCRDSHLRILSKMEKGGITAIYEDDVMFLQPLDIMQKALDQLPEDWDCLYLGASPQEPQTRVDTNLFRIKNSWCMHSVVWHNRNDGAVQYILSQRDRIKKIDVFVSQEVMPRFNCFLAYPMVCTQKETGTSDTCKRSDVLTIKRNYDKYCSI